MIQILELISPNIPAIEAREVEQVTNEEREILSSTFVENKDAYIIKLGYGVKMKGNWYRVVEINVSDNRVVVGNKFRNNERLTALFTGSSEDIFDFSEERTKSRRRKRISVMK